MIPEAYKHHEEEQRSLKPMILTVVNTTSQQYHKWKATLLLQLIHLESYYILSIRSVLNMLMPLVKC